jgi:NAD+ synthase (glutamine-hydrolysing)
MRIALAQMNSCLGDFRGNADKIIEMSQNAKEKRCDLILFPEMNLFGYHPCDLLERPGVYEKQKEALDDLVLQMPEDIYCLIGAVTENKGRGKNYFNSALLIHNHKIIKSFHKELLPVYDVFDDSRHFASGRIEDNRFEIKGQRVQVLICEDMWGWDPLHASNPIETMDPQEVDLVLNLSASPFTHKKRFQRKEMARKTVRSLQAPLIYVNMVGGQDELIYDGGSFSMSEKGDVLAQSAYFIEDINIVDLNDRVGGLRQEPESSTSHLHQALVLGIRDFVGKIGFKRAHLGLSGGIDSAVVACLVADAIGPQNVTCMGMPSRFNQSMSLDLARDLAKNLGCAFFNLPIQEAYEQVIQSYEQCFGPKEFSLVHENVQARLRGLFLMAYCNEHQSLLVTTGNKSEYATGYSTLYGDMCGGLAPIADLLKSQVYELANHYNKQQELIPEMIITRPPSAELRPNQKDNDSLPDYDELDRSVEKLVEQRFEAESDIDEWVLERLYVSEFKRWQAPPILKISDHAFGQGRRMPIAHKLR